MPAPPDAAADARGDEVDEITTSDARASLLSNSFWISLSEALKTIASVASALVAARVLSKADFGLMGIVMLTASILNTLTQTGFDQALIQRKDDVTALLDVAWTWQLLRGVALGLLLVVLAPGVAAFYDEPLLTALIAVSALRVVAQGGVNIGVLFFKRQLDFKKLFLINTLQAFVQAGVAIPAILIWHNVWGLVAGTIAEAVVALIISYIAHPYRPRLAWNPQLLRELTGYGKWITGLTIMLFVITQGDDIFVSKYLGAAALGAYQMAYMLSNTPATKIAHVLSQVSFPSYARLQDDPPELRRAFTGVMRATLLLSGPLSVLIAALIPDIVAHVLSPKWAPIISLVQILVISAFIRAFAALAGALFRACDRPDWDLKMNLPRLVIIVGLIWPACAWRGLEGACWVVTLAIASCLPMWFYGVRALVGLRVRDVLRENALALVSTGALALMMWAVQPLRTGQWWAAIGAALAGVAGWLLLMRLLGALTPYDLFAELRRVRTIRRDLAAPAPASQGDAGA